MKKKLLPVFAAFAIMAVMAVQSHAVGTALFTLPEGFVGDVTETQVEIAGGILTILALMFAYRKSVKSVNRS